MYKKQVKENTTNNSIMNACDLMVKIIAEQLKIQEIEEKFAAQDEQYLPKEGMGKCCLCKENLSHTFNSPIPLKKRGNCCDKCNHEKVIPARMGDMLLDFQQGTWEEQKLQRKLFLLFDVWDLDHEPFNQIKLEYGLMVRSRGFIPNYKFEGDRRSISYTPI
jgi:hypothetical protein